MVKKWAKLITASCYQILMFEVWFPMFFRMGNSNMTLLETCVDARRVGTRLGAQEHTSTKNQSKLHVTYQNIGFWGREFRI